MNSVLTVLRSTLYSLQADYHHPLYFSSYWLRFLFHRSAAIALRLAGLNIMLFLFRLICGIRYRIIRHRAHSRGSKHYFIKHHPPGKTRLSADIPRSGLGSQERTAGCHFCWGLALTSPIAIDRSSRKAALKQIVEQGKDRLCKAILDSNFPGGDTHCPGEKGQMAGIMVRGLQPTPGRRWCQLHIMQANSGAELS